MVTSWIPDPKIGGSIPPCDQIFGSLLDPLTTYLTNDGKVHLTKKDYTTTLKKDAHTRPQNRLEYF